MILGVGIDIVDIARISKVGIMRLAKRILTVREYELLPELESKRLERVAGLFVAKEAIVKALGTGIGGRCGFLDIEIIKDALGAPHVSLKNRVSETFASKLQIHLSISHTKEYAVATAVIEA